MSCGGYDLHLPPEICSEILTRLPIKSILRFRSVSKSWHSLISCPHFKTKTDRILLNRFDYSGASSLTSHDLSFSEEPRDLRDDLPHRFRDQRLDPIGSCDGLFCLYNLQKQKQESVYSFFICNPAIRKIVELPPLILGLSTHIPRFFGFGFDSNAGDYKVMLIFLDGIQEKHVCFMFDLRNGVWRDFEIEIEIEIPPIMSYWGLVKCRSDFYLNDALHYSGKTTQLVSFILSFNMSDETFRVISMPAEFNRGCPQIMTSGGLIYALAWNWVGVRDQQFSVWVMKEYGVVESWNKVFVVDMPPQFWPASVFPLTIRGLEAGEVLLMHCSNESNECVEGFKQCQHLILHNNGSGESKWLLSTNKCILDLVFYKESLVLM